MHVDRTESNNTGGLKVNKLNEWGGGGGSSWVCKGLSITLDALGLVHLCVISV